MNLRNNLNLEEPIAQKLIALLVASILIPEILNAGLQFCSNPFLVSSLKKRFGLILIAPLTPAVAIYMDLRYKITKENTLHGCLSDNKLIDQKEKEKLNLCDRERKKWNRLLAKMRSNENLFDHFIQNLVLVIFVTLSFTTTHTMTKGKQIQTLIAPEPKMDPYFLLSAVWSFCSITRGHLYWYKVQKDEYVPICGSIILICFVALTLIGRLCAVYFYLAPSMGFFNLLTHKKFGQVPL